MYQVVCSLVDGWDSTNCGVIEQDISRSMSRIEVTPLCLGNESEYWVFLPIGRIYMLHHHEKLSKVFR
jgi:hypothetical protein